MTIFILDLDWMFDKSEIPNINCMKISSFHKQLGHQVYLINDISELHSPYDKLYIWGESDSIPTLSHKILNDKRTMMFGKRFEFCNSFFKITNKTSRNYAQKSSIFLAQCKA